MNISIIMLASSRISTITHSHKLLGRAQPVIPPNLYVNEHNSLGSSGKVISSLECKLSRVITFQDARRVGLIDGLGQIFYERHPLR